MGFLRYWFNDCTLCFYEGTIMDYEFTQCRLMMDFRKIRLLETSGDSISGSVPAALFKVQGRFFL